jgi:hypothetical protein
MKDAPIPSFASLLVAAKAGNPLLNCRAASWPILTSLQNACGWEVKPVVAWLGLRSKIAGHAPLAPAKGRGQRKAIPPLAIRLGGHSISAFLASAENSGTLTVDQFQVRKEVVADGKSID